MLLEWRFLMWGYTNNTAVFDRVEGDMCWIKLIFSECNCRSKFYLVNSRQYSI